MVITRLAGGRTKQGDNLGERVSVKLPLLCPVCRTREALLRYSRKDTAYMVCTCGVRIFVWGAEAEDLLLKRIKDYKDAKAKGRLEEYKKSQKAVR